MSVKTVIPIKKAPLKANNSFILSFFIGFIHKTNKTPIIIERKGSK